MEAESIAAIFGLLLMLVIFVVLPIWLIVEIIRWLRRH